MSQRKIIFHNYDFDSFSPGLPEKRTKKNHSNFTEFFSASGKWGGRKRILNKFSVQEVINLAKLYNEYRIEIEEIQAFARKFPKSVAQMNPQDAASINDYFSIHDVMES